METILALIFIIIIFLYSALKVVREYERLVVFRLGRLVGSKGPGLVILIPLIDHFVRVSLRVVTLDVPTQDVVTRDNVICSVNAVVYYRVVDAANAIVNVENYREATAQLSQTTLRSVAGQAELDELLAERDKLNQQIQKSWMKPRTPGNQGYCRGNQRCGYPENLQRAISRQAAAERERRAAIIQAEGEKQAAQKLADAASILANERWPVWPSITDNSGNSRSAGEYCCLSPSFGTALSGREPFYLQNARPGGDDEKEQGSHRQVKNRRNANNHLVITEPGKQ